MALNSLVNVLAVLTAFLCLGSFLIKKGLKDIRVISDHLSCVTDCDNPAELHEADVRLLISDWASPVKCL